MFIVNEKKKVGKMLRKLPPEVQQRIYRSTLQAVKDGKLSRADIDASVRRIVYCKLKTLTDPVQREKLYKKVIGK